MKVSKRSPFRTEEELTGPAQGDGRQSSKTS